MNLRVVISAVLCAALAACASRDARDGSVEPAPDLLSWDDVRALSVPDAVPSLFYGTEAAQHGELRLPPGVPGPFPVLVLIPGDCWTSAEEGAGYLRPLAASLSTLGVATWTVEYRRPANGDASVARRDVAMAADHLRVLAQAYPLNLKRVVAAGHGSGAELALWLAARDRLGKDDPLYMRRPLPVHGVIGLAAVTELPATAVAPACPQPAADDTGRKPVVRLPLGVPQWFVHGALDPLVPAESVMRYAEAARKKGDDVTLGITSNAGHYEPVVPASSTWMTLQQAVIAALHN